MGELVQFPIGKQSDGGSFDDLVDAILDTCDEHREDGEQAFNKALFERLAADGVDLAKILGD
jgi:hypothetical protein